jgi:hypothetical protein
MDSYDLNSHTMATAMGTPCACSYTTLNYALHKVRSILSALAKFIMIIKRFIEDMLGIWIGGNGEDLKQFKKALEGFRKLK